MVNSVFQVNHPENANEVTVEFDSDNKLINVTYDDDKYVDLSSELNLHFQREIKQYNDYADSVREHGH